MVTRTCLADMSAFATTGAIYVPTVLRLHSRSCGRRHLGAICNVCPNATPSLRTKNHMAHDMNLFLCFRFLHGFCSPAVSSTSVASLVAFVFFYINKMHAFMPSLH